MYFYRVVTGSMSFHGEEALTYHNQDTLARGTIVSVPLRKASVVGVVVDRVAKPPFATKEIGNTLHLTPLPEQTLKLMEWIRAYYAASFGGVARLFLPPSLAKGSRKSFPGSKQTDSTPMPPLTHEQKEAVRVINTGASNSYLIHGETGSGKTRLYMEVAKKTLKTGKSVLVLVPEIGLTSQLANDLVSHFTHPVLVLHSQMTEAERRAIWRTVHESDKPLVIVGPRSALFLPYHHLGLVVVDEMHDQAYKQEQSPRYHALRIAAKLTSLHDALLLLGSATPSVTDYYIAETKNVPILRLTKQAITSDSKAAVSVIDLKDRDSFSRSPILSDALLEAIQEALKRHEQSLVFLNRRGTARVVLCQNCGWQALCPRCDIPLIYHGDHHTLKCHTCGFNEPTPSSCPTCHNADILFKAFGTKAVVDELHKLFPEVRVQRFDTDNKKAERFEKHYDAIKQGAVDILVGTQTLTKGLDLPRLSVVGVLAADSSLQFPDYTASERTYQLLAQVIGRVGRGHTAHGAAIIQTYNPNDVVIRAAIERDWQTFYKAELAERQQFFFPPFCHLLKLTIERSSQNSALQAAVQLTRTLQDSKLPIQVIGPAPSFIEKVQNKYRWQLIIKSKHRTALLQVLTDLPNGWAHDIDPQHLL